MQPRQIALALNDEMPGETFVARLRAPALLRFSPLATRNIHRGTNPSEAFGRSQLFLRLRLRSRSAFVVQVVLSKCFRKADQCLLHLSRRRAAKWLSCAAAVSNIPSTIRKHKKSGPYCTCSFSIFIIPAVVVLLLVGKLYVES